MKVELENLFTFLFFLSRVFVCCDRQKMFLRFVTIGLVLTVHLVLSEPTMYKKNEQNVYEPGKNTKYY